MGMAGCVRTIYRDSDEYDVDVLKWTVGPVLTSVEEQPPPLQLPFQLPTGTLTT